MVLLSIVAAQQDSMRSGPNRLRCVDVSMNKQVIKAIPEGISDDVVHNR